MFVPASENMASNDVCTILANKKLENKQLRLMFVPASWRSAAGVCAGGLNGHWGSRAPVEDIYTRGRSCTQSGGGASQSARRHHWTPAALAVAPGANINYSCSGESSCCSGNWLWEEFCKLRLVHNFCNLLPNYFQVERGPSRGRICINSKYQNIFTAYFAQKS